MENATIYWAVLCLAIALVLFFLELFVPSGGLIAVVAAISLAAGIVLLFKVSTTLGLIGAIVTLVSAPFVLAIAMKLWPNTPLGRVMILHSAKPSQRPPDDPLPDADELAALVGRTGKVTSDLRPVGTCVIDGKRHECMADGGVIGAGSTVRVVSVDGRQIKVREAS